MISFVIRDLFLSPESQSIFDIVVSFFKSKLSAGVGTNCKLNGEEWAIRKGVES